jgi:hypothetical protein
LAFNSSRLPFNSETRISSTSSSASGITFLNRTVESFSISSIPRQFGVAELPAPQRKQKPARAGARS